MLFPKFQKPILTVSCVSRPKMSSSTSLSASPFHDLFKPSQNKNYMQEPLNTLTYPPRTCIVSWGTVHILFISLQGFMQDPVSMQAFKILVQVRSNLSMTLQGPSGDNEDFLFVPCQMYGVEYKFLPVPGRVFPRLTLLLWALIVSCLDRYCPIGGSVYQGLLRNPQYRVALP